jgi:ferredoxin
VKGLFCTTYGPLVAATMGGMGKWPLRNEKETDMAINSLRLVYFSPTQTTKRVLESIAQGIGVNTVRELDLTPRETEGWGHEEIRDDLVIIGAPVYAGRIPVVAARRLRRLQGRDSAAVIVVVYGNRAYEDALLELKDLALEVGFIPVAGGTFIGEHSFSDVTTPIATGRPDVQDLDKAVEFGRMVQKKMTSMQALADMSPLQVPGNSPYRDRRQLPKVSPTTDEALCAQCKSCVSVCPTGAVELNDTLRTDPDLCILCCACVKNCPTGARTMEDASIRQLAERLSKSFPDRKEPEMYL